VPVAPSPTQCFRPCCKGLLVTNSVQPSHLASKIGELLAPPLLALIIDQKSCELTKALVVFLYHAGGS
jgi:hypothetical protein